MGWNVLFQSPGYALVTNKILKLLDYDSIMVCREVSPIWKECIDMQRFCRVNHFLSLMDKHFLNRSLIHYIYYRFPNFDKIIREWKKVIPFIKTNMSVFDLDKLIAGVQVYIDLDVEDWENDDECDCGDQVEEWCPLHWAVHYKNFEFVEVMIRTSFDFNTLRFAFEKNPKEKARPPCDNDKCEETKEKAEIHNRHCEDYFDDYYYDDDLTHKCVGGNNVLHKAARNGDMKMIKLIFKYAEDKKIDINAKNDCEQSAIVTAKDDPEVVKLLMKHCKYPESDVGLLGLKTLTAMAKSFVTEKHEPPKKEMKNSKK